MEALLLFLVMGVIVGMIASSARGRSFVPWFFYGMVIFPVAVIHILLTKNLDEEICPHCGGMKVKNAPCCKNCGKAKEVAPPEEKSVSPASTDNLHACIDCAKMISKRAPFCPNCGAPNSEK